MVRLFLCGPGGSGKTTLATELLKQRKFRNYGRVSEVARRIMDRKGWSRADLEQDGIYFRLQEEILQQQCLDERVAGEAFISDRCVLDCFAYALWRRTCQSTETKLESIIQKYQDLVDEVVQRYQGSLMVVVHPWTIEESTKDGTRITMTHGESSRFLEYLHNLFRRFRIGWMDLYLPDPEERIRILKSALEEGKIPRSDCCLRYYASLTEKGSARSPARTASENQETLIPFYLQKKQGSIRTVKVSDDLYTFMFTTQKNGKVSRFVQRFGVEDLACIEFDMKIRPEDVQKFLKNPIYINGDRYSFLGCSSSGIKARKAFLWKGNAQAAAKVLQDCGHFDRIASVSNRMARTGLLFSSVHPTGIDVNDGDIVRVDDIIHDDYTFTDGCGGIGSKLGRRVYAGINDHDKVTDLPGYVPAVFQFRLQGFKGVLALDPAVPDEKILVRPSMEKFQTKSFPQIAICRFSRPYSYGHLNRQLIYLLSGLGVPDESFVQLQQEFFHLLSGMHGDPEAAVKILQRENHLRQVEMILQSTEGNSSGATQSYLQKDLNQLKEAFLNKDLKIKGDGGTKEKLRILVFKSRFVYGVCDQSNRLEYGQCFLRLTINGVPKTMTGKIVTGRMPCYLLGDIRVLEAVDIPQLEHLVDCIVFPVRGRRPHADEQAGGDLDGDQFFVCWDERLVPLRTIPSVEYPAAAAKPEPPVTLAGMLRYFSIQNEAMRVTGLLANLYNDWADYYGPQCRECESIGILFGRAIDATKSGEVVVIPDHLKNPPKEPPQRRFVWQLMESGAQSFKAELVKAELQFPGKLTGDCISESFILELLQDDFTNLTEFQKFEFAWRFCVNLFGREMEPALEHLEQNFLDNINFSLFSSLEKSMAIDMGIKPALVGNALTRSLIFSSRDREKFQIEAQFSHWGLYYQADRSSFDFYMLQRALTSFNCTMLFIRMPDAVTLCFRFGQPLENANAAVLDKEKFEVLFVSPRFGIWKKMDMQEDFFYDLDQERFQIYRRGLIADSLLWLRRGTQDAVWKPKEFPDSLSIDLVKSRFTGKDHPRIRKTPLLAVEIFAYKDLVPAYPDILYANDVEDVPEVDEDHETEAENQAAPRFLDQILMDRLLGVPDKLSLVQLKAKLIELVVATTPWNDEPNPESKERLSHLFRDTDWKSAEFLNLMDLAILLSRLNQDHILQELLGEASHRKVEFQELLEVFSDWSVCWYIPPNQLVPLVQTVTERIWIDPGSSAVTQYLVRLFWNCFVEFINDITVCKEDISKGALGRLKVDFSAKEASGLNEVTLYQSAFRQTRSLIPCGGERGILIRTGDWNNRKSWNAANCLVSVIQVTPVPLHVRIEIKDPVVPAVLQEDMEKPTKAWMLNFLDNANISLYSRVVTSCKRILSKAPLDENLAKLITGDPTPARIKAEQIRTTQAEDKLSGSLNPAQKGAVLAGLNSPVTLIHGPPGTGKTKVACSLLEIMAKRAPGKILAVAETNNAVDNMCRRLLELGAKILRIGNVKFVSGNLYSHTLEGQLKIRAAQEAVKTEFRTDSGRVLHKKKFIKDVLNEAEVILATCTGAGDPDILDKDFTFVLVDEATQTKEHTLLCSLSHRAQQLVLIGDPKQLGPLVNVEEDWNWLEKPQWDQVTQGLEQTLFHRLYVSRMKVHMLDTQYRMHPEIAAFPSQKFYEGKLKSGVTSDLRRPPWLVRLKSAVLFVNVEGQERRTGTSWTNEDEISKTEEVVGSLMSMDVTAEQMVVLTLYSGQVTSLKRKFGNKVLVSSIDGFQGREAEIVVVSTVRARGNLGFSDDPKRLNVLLTRAKRGLIVIGHGQTLATCGIWKSWLESACVIDGLEQVRFQAGKPGTESKTHRRKANTK